MDSLKAAVEALRNCRSLLVLTGAGISSESGVQTYRGPGGRYTNSPGLQHVLTAENLERNPVEVWKYVDQVRAAVSKARPNKAHQVLAEWEKRGVFKRFLIATQNIDDLHKAAGSNQVTELHGNIWQFAAPKESAYFEDDDFSEEMSAFLSETNRESLLRKWSEENNCTVWENREVPFASIPPSEDPSVRPNVVFFNESYGNRLLLVDHFIKGGCDVALVVGCSGGVFILYQLLTNVFIHSPGCKVVNINPHEDCIEGEHIYCKLSAVEAFEILDKEIRKAL